MPILSVIFASYNEKESNLVKSIESILNQDFNDYEVLIPIEPNEKNTQLLAEFAQRYPKIILLYKKNKTNLASALNHGLKHARGKYIARMDSDDISSKYRFSLQYQFMENNPEIDILSSSMNIIDTTGENVSERIYPTNHYKIKRSFLYKCGISHPGVFFRRNLLKKHTGYDASLNYAEDLDLWLRCLSSGLKFANLNEKCIQYRLTETNLNRSSSNHWQIVYKIRSKHAKNIWPVYIYLPINFLYWLLSKSSSQLRNILLHPIITNFIRSCRKN